MKKKVVLFIISAMLLSGCGLGEIELDLNKSAPRNFNELDFNNNFTEIFSSSTEIYSSSSTETTISSSKKDNSSSTTENSSSKPAGSSSKIENSSTASIPEKIIEENPSSATISVISFDNTLHRNNDAVVVIKGKPNTKYSIEVIYSSGPSTAKGLEDKISDENGFISWTWHVGGRTRLGDGKTIKISGGGESITLTFSVVS